MENNQQTSVQISSQMPLEIGLMWDFENDVEVDLDATVVMIDEVGNIKDAVFYNKMQSDCGSIMHSGDSKDGKKDGYDEIITINLEKVHYAVQFLVVLVNSFEGAGFSHVETANVSLMQNNHQQVLDTNMLGSIRAGDANGILAFIIYRNNQHWDVYKGKDTSPGKVFTECEQMIKNNLKYAGFDEDLLGESKAWDGKKKFNLVKDHAVILPGNLTHLRIGLGWDTRLDIDASVILYDKNGRESDTIYFGKLKNANSSVVHQGDNLTGEGEGDDEVIDIELGLIPENVESIWPVITIYTSGKNFSQVSGAFCRMLDKSTGKEFCRFTLSDCKDGRSNGNIMGVIIRCGT
jgi:stress response protein SCP2